MIELSPIARFGLLLVRPGMIVMVAPGFGGTYAPTPVKVGLTVLLGLALAPAVQLPSTGEVALAVVVAREVAIGMSLALVLRALIAAAEFAGHLSGFQIGFSYGATVDPTSGVRNTMTATLYGLLAVFFFLGVNAHHAVLRALADSYVALPIGFGGVDESLVASVRQICALVFTIGLRLAAPVVIVVLLVELAVGLISRTAPSLSMMVIGFPLRIAIGLAVMAVAIAAIPGVVSSVVERVLSLAVGTAAAFR